jgi:hypothetical protein
MDAAEREAQVRRFIDKVWNARNYDAAADLYAAAYADALGSGPSAEARLCGATTRHSPTFILKSTN